MAAEPPKPSKKTLFVKPMLIPEILGYSSQLLLDEIINISNNAAEDAMDGMGKMLTNWAEKEKSLPDNDLDEEDLNQEVEQGLAQFANLLEYHTDVATDSFETWSLRNIFNIEPDFPYVLPHHENLDLSATAEQEQELVDEIETLRRQIQDQRHIKRELSRAVRVSEVQRQRAEKRQGQLQFLQSPGVDTIESLPKRLSKMHEAVASLPPLDSESMSFLTRLQSSDPAKRPWETSKAGYLNWAVSQLVGRAKEQIAREGKPTTVDGMLEHTGNIGTADQLREALDVVEDVRIDLSTMSEDPDPNAMEE